MMLGVRLLHASCSHVVWRSFSSAAAAAAAATVVVESRGPVRVITLNRPECCNAVNQSTAKQLYQAFSEFDLDATAHAAVLHGLGGNFSAGYDLKELANTGETINLEEDIGHGPSPMVSALSPSHHTHMQV